MTVRGLLARHGRWGPGMRQAWEGTYDPYTGQTTQRLTFIVVAHNVTRAEDCRCAAAAPGVEGCDDAYLRWANVSVRGRLAPSSVCQVVPGASPAAAAPPPTPPPVPHGP